MSLFVTSMKMSLTLIVISLWIGLVNNVRVDNNTDQLPIKHSEVNKVRSFTVDYDNNRFLLNGRPFRYVAGEIHYFRVPNQYWPDRLSKMRLSGVNVLQTYIEWSFHETKDGFYRFHDDANLTKFLQDAQQADLLVALRVGPYICSERDMGGLPWWLLQYNVKLRQNDKVYMNFVQRWFNIVLPKIRPYLYQNGGPIIMIQLENEYGYYHACDFGYMSALRDLVRSHLGPEIVLYTTDGINGLKCGLVDGALGTIDFGLGNNPKAQFHNLRLHRASGPLVNSEFWIGKIDTWGQGHQVRSVNDVAYWLNAQLGYQNMSVNLYMFHGGTSFGFTSGANSGEYLPRPTTYDEDALLDEAGDLTRKYYATRNVIKKYFPVLEMEKIPVSRKLALGQLNVPVKLMFNEFFSLPSWKINKSESPVAFEYLGARNGIVLYSTIIPFKPASPSLLNINQLRDRAYVFVDQEYQGVVSRQENALLIPIKANKDSKLDIIVENQGRIYFGDKISQHKGIFGTVKLGSKILTNWSHYYIDDWEDAALSDGLLNATRVSKFENHSGGRSSLNPAVLRVEFVLPINVSLADTFLNPSNMSKGFAYINGKALGRYWPNNGPQVTLYTPGVWLKAYPEKNELILVELEDAPCLVDGFCVVSFDDKAILDGPTPDNF